MSAAAEHALTAYPGPVGELIHREVQAFLDFGYRFGGSGLAERLVDHVLAARPALAARQVRRGAHRRAAAMTSTEDTLAPNRVDMATKERLRAAATRATQLHPGPVGELLNQELLSWMVFGHRLGSALIMRVTDELLIEEPQKP